MVSTRDQNWDKVLGAVLFAYSSTQHQLAGEIPFYLVYGREPNLSAALKFQMPVSKFPIFATDYVIALVQEELEYV